MSKSTHVLNNTNCHPSANMVRLHTGYDKLIVGEFGTAPGWILGDISHGVSGQVVVLSIAPPAYITCLPEPCKPLSLPVIFPITLELCNAKLVGKTSTFWGFAIERCIQGLHYNQVERVVASRSQGKLRI